jgi:hypothetical protein
MSLRSPVQRHTLITVVTGLVWTGLLVAIKSMRPHAGDAGLVFALFVIATCAVLGFAWSLASALISERRARK